MANIQLSSMQTTIATTQRMAAIGLGIEEHVYLNFTGLQEL